MSGGVFVYIIGTTCGRLGCLKIGIAADPFKRVRQMQTGNPFPLSILHLHGPTKRVIAGQVEYRTHQLLGSRRQAGEWFECPAEEAIEAMTDAARWVRNRRGDLAYQPQIKRMMSLGVRSGAVQ